MKRILVVLLALVMGAGLLFAADPAKWGAYLEGYYYFWNQDGQVAVTDWYTAYTLSYAETVFGFTATMEPAQTDFYVAWRNIQGWYSMFDGMLKVTAGKDRISDYRATTFEDGGNAYTRFANAEWGLALQAMPVKGASVGAFVKFPTALTDQDYVNMLAFGASYAIPDMATINVVFRTMDSAITTPVVDVLENEFGVSAAITAVKILPINIGYGLKLYTTSDPRHNILVSTKYSVNQALSLAFDANVTYWTANANDFGYAADLAVTYVLSKAFTAGIQLEYGNQSYADMTGGGFFVWPWIQANVGAGTLRLGFQFDTDGDGTGSDVDLWSIPLLYTMSF